MYSWRRSLFSFILLNLFNYCPASLAQKLLQWFKFFLRYSLSFTPFPKILIFQEILILEIVMPWRRETLISYRKKLDRLGKGLHVNSTLKIVKLSISQITFVGIGTDVTLFSLNWQYVTDRSSGSRLKWLYKNLG